MYAFARPAWLASWATAASGAEASCLFTPAKGLADGFTSVSRAGAARSSGAGSWASSTRPSFGEASVSSQMMWALKRRSELVARDPGGEGSHDRSDQWPTVMCPVFTEPVMMTSRAGDQNANAPQTPWWPTTCAVGNRGGDRAQARRCRSNPQLRRVTSSRWASGLATSRGAGAGERVRDH